MKQNYHSQQGTITPTILILSSAFIVIIYALLFILTLQLGLSNRQTAQEQALNIAEAGINYYRWHLAHDPNDFKDGTVDQPGPYIHDYYDPQGRAVGKYSLVITAPANGFSIVTIESTGWTNLYPNIKRVIKAEYGKPSYARYSFLQNASSWYGSGLTVNGRIHSNNGIRMDGINTSLVTSAKLTYTCGSETGCFPSQQRPGIWGAGPGGGLGLWQFPIPAVDFDTISFDFSSMRTASQTNGLYLAASGSRGYHLIFVNDGTVRVNRVTNTNYYRGYDEDDGCHNIYQRITNENQIGIYNLTTTPIIFAEDHLWIEGQVRGNITVIAARFPIESNSMNIWIPNNLTYYQYDHTNSLGVIAQNDIYFTRNIPDNFRIDAAMMAQKGKIIRHGYLWWCGGTTQAVKNSLTINGTIISYKKSYWNFGTSPDSGFRTRQINYDADLLYRPPPYFPTTGDYEFVSWMEK